jgi:DNA-binding NarL/FixJ family response regulator
MGLHIHLVDDHRLFRQGLRMLIENIPEVEKITESDNGQEFLDSLSFSMPDLVLIDIEMPVLNGIEATRKALQINPELKIIALSMYGDEDYYYQMIDAGARGFVIKNTDFNEVKKAIFSVLDQNNYFSEELLYALIRNIKSHKTETPENVLSDREKDILFEICKGLSNQEIADKLEISKRTVDKHRCNILLKTGCKNTASLVIYAMKHRLIEI